MRTQCRILSLLFLFGICINASGQYIDIMPERVMVFEFDTENGFAYKEAVTRGESGAPVCPEWVDEHTLVVYDPFETALKYFVDFKYDRSVTIGDESIKYGSPHRISQIENGYVFYMDTWGVTIIRYLNENITKEFGSTSLKEPLYHSHAQVFQNVWIYWDPDYNIMLRVLNEPGIEPGPLMDTDKARVYLDSIGGGKDKLSIDNMGVLHVDGKPYLDSSRNLIRYYSSKDKNWLDSPKHLRKMGSFYFLRRLPDGTTYWATHNSNVLILGADGYVKTIVSPDKHKEISWKTISAVHPSGDIYWIGLDYSEERNKEEPYWELGLYRQKKIW